MLGTRDAGVRKSLCFHAAHRLDASLSMCSMDCFCNFLPPNDCTFIRTTVMEFIQHQVFFEERRMDRVKLGIDDNAGPSVPVA